MRAVVSELIGLFVDDGRFAIAILAWVALCWVLLPRFGWSPVVLFAGFVLILVESAVRRARAT